MKQSLFLAAASLSLLMLAACGEEREAPKQATPAVEVGQAVPAEVGSEPAATVQPETQAGAPWAAAAPDGAAAKAASAKRPPTPAAAKPAQSPPAARTEPDHSNMPGMDHSNMPGMTNPPATPRPGG